VKLEPNIFPIDNHLEEIASSLESNSCLLIKAETGAGKTTRLPPFLVNKTKGKVLVLEPRRLAAKLSAQRCAQILDGKLGQQVGHHIRFDKVTSEETKLLFITEGLFLPYLREDRQLSDYSTIIIDEFHERSIHTDIALSLIRHLQLTTRPDLKLIVMSATLDTFNLEKYLENPCTYNISGRTFPIEIEYSDIQTEDAIEEMVKDIRSPQNILVFLPGMGAIRKVESNLKNRFKDIDIIPLHSSLPKKDQNKAFTGSNRKIILSTNIAETSLTIPNVTGVIDTGTERRASFAPWSGMPLLQLEKISKASATQRAGRAGRVQNGIVYRTYKESDFVQRMAFTPPEIKRVELSHYILDLLELDIDPEDFNWFEEPENNNLKKSLDLLETLGAIKSGKITKCGKFLARLPLHPRFGAMIYQDQSPDTILAACILSESMVLSKNAEFSKEDEEVCDLSIQCDLIKAHVHNDNKLSDYNLSLLDKRSAKRVLELYSAISKRFKISNIPLKEKTNSQSLTRPLLAGYPDRIAAKRQVNKKGKSSQSYNFCLGRGGKLSWKSSLNSTYPDYIIVLDALENPKANAAIGTTIQAASKVSKEELLNSNSPLLHKEKESSFNDKKGTLSLSSNLKYGKLTLKSEIHPPVVPKGEVLVELMLENWPWPFEDDKELIQYNQRVKILNSAKIEHNCALIDEEMFELFIESCIDSETSFQDLLAQGLNKLIYDQLSPQDQYVLDKEAPLKIELENNKSFNISYDNETPQINARIQDLYSVKTHPKIANNTTGLTVNLLSPADRVSQVVSDLPGFWQSSWEVVKKELKARYPKHYWPDNPQEAQPIRVKKK
jgi:ATP-dependent helicase HrpB